MAHDYEAIDHDPMPGDNYYRLKQTDFNGEVDYSEVIIVDVSNTHIIKLNVYPVPARDELTLEFALGNAGPVEVEVQNIMGATIDKGIMACSKGNNSLKRNISKFPKGTYLIKVIEQSSGMAGYRRFIKQ